MKLDPTTRRQLDRYLGQLLDRHDPKQHRRHDPVRIPRSYDDPRDREVAGLIAASLAYGQVNKVLDAVDRALEPLDPSPAESLRERRDWREHVSTFRYRMTSGPDLADLLAALSTTLRREGSLETLYHQADSSDHLSSASFFVQTLRRRRLRDDCERGFRYLLVDPGDGSACKRLHMFFRWMGRGPDVIDPGGWDRLEPSQLVMPMDTHTSRLCRYIGLTDRKSVDGKMASDVTHSLRQLDARDPTRYDFALAHLGIADDCIHERSEDHCPGCPIEPICTLE